MTVERQKAIRGIGICQTAQVFTCCVRLNSLMCKATSDLHSRGFMNRSLHRHVTMNVFGKIIGKSFQARSEVCLETICSQSLGSVNLTCFVARHPWLSKALH